MKIEFYDDYFSIQPFSQTNEGNTFKDNFIRSKIKNGKIYKFVAFNEDEQLNSKKLTMLAQLQFWASCYDYFDDDREVLRPYNQHKICCKTKISKEKIDNFFSTINEMNDISCFTYEPSDFMWNEYANNQNGFCMEFNLLDSDKFFPIIYLDKDKLDYTDDIAKLLTSTKYDLISLNRVTILPWVTKDPIFQKENELRFLCGDIYDNEDGPMSGIIAPGKKKSLGYKGIEYSFKSAGLELQKIRIGSNCTKEKELLEICNSIKIPMDKI